MHKERTEQAGLEKSTPAITNNSVVVAITSQVSCDLGGEEVILSLDNGVYYGLDPVGTWIWSLIQEPKVVSDILVSLLERYDVEPERGESDLQALLCDLASEGLIEVDGVAVA
jgi:hypothetical protein